MPGPAARLVFLTPPLDASYAKKFTVQVALLDRYGNLATNDRSSVILSLARSRNGAKLNGTTPQVAVNGIATFPNLWLDRRGAFILLAIDSSDSLNAYSPIFNVR